MLRLHVTTAGESHGRGLAVTVTGLPAGLELSKEAIDRDLARRQRGYGRGARMQIEADEADVIAGLRHGRTLGSPVTILIWNRDWPNWQEDMAPWPAPAQSPTRPEVRKPRPGHADLPGALKYGVRDIRDILERSSARETAARVAAGAVCKQLLALFGIRVRSQVLQIGDVQAAPADLADDQAWERVEQSPVRCADAEASQRMCEAIDAARDAGDTLGGVGQVAAIGCPPGLGGYATWHERLDAALAWALMSIPSVKAVSIGDGWASASRPGSQVHDEIIPAPDRPWRLAHKTNCAGGVEGGMSNGEPILAHLAFKPIPTLRQPLASVNLDTGRPDPAHAERSDVCIVPAGCVVAEAMAAIVLADLTLHKFGGDSIGDTLAAWQSYLRRLEAAVAKDE